MKKLLYILLTISITCPCLASGINDNGGFDPIGDSIGEGPTCVHLNLNTGVAEKYAYYNRNNSCPPFTSADAWPLNNFEINNVRYDISGQTNFIQAPNSTIITLSFKLGGINSIPVRNYPNTLHPNDHSCKLGLFD
ncbi:MAG: hypothetical protein JKX98_12715 [Alcanivoracaceae bacterium]|nr:hypothetical protein [Alcanivoracaceae bacterium]